MNMKNIFDIMDRISKKYGLKYIKPVQNRFSENNYWKYGSSIVIHMNSDNLTIFGIPKTTIDDIVDINGHKCIQLRSVVHNFSKCDDINDFERILDNDVEQCIKCMDLQDKLDRQYIVRNKILSIGSDE